MTLARANQYVPYDAFLRTLGREETQKCEWVDGVVYAMTHGSPEHARLTNRVVAKVLSVLAGDDCESYSTDAAIFIETANQHTYADASVVCGPLITRTVYDKNGKSIGEAIVNPAVIVEVLSEATERYDRDGKFEAYKKLPSFETYVLVSQDERRIEVRTRRDGAWETSIGTAGERVTIHGREFAVDSIYA